MDPDMQLPCRETASRDITPEAVHQARKVICANDKGDAAGLMDMLGIGAGQAITVTYQCPRCREHWTRRAVLGHIRDAVIDHRCARCVKGGQWRHVHPERQPRV